MFLVMFSYVYYDLCLGPIYVFFYLYCFPDNDLGVQKFYVTWLRLITKLFI